MSPNKVERLSPRYVAFRTGNWIAVPVIARIESHRSGRWWGYWFSKHTPEGLFKEVPSSMSSRWKAMTTLTNSSG